MRQFLARAQEAGARLVESTDEQLLRLAGSPRHQGVVARVTPLKQQHSLDDLLDENQHAPTIVVYQFKAEREELRRRYPHARGIDAMDDWNAGRVRLLLLHPKSAGHGLNLQHGGSHIVFFSLPWSLEFYEQTIGRLHRSGQRHDVWCYLLLTRRTVDERIHEALKQKLTLSEIAIHELANADASDRNLERGRTQAIA
jgi:SNF2 family DNA or RNA helicase